jgi:tetratricopeptide (TPR) repeat protein
MRERINSARILAKEGKYEEAITQLRSLFEESSDLDYSGRIHAALGYVYSRRGDIEFAIEEMDKAIECCTLEPAYFFKRGRYLLKIGKLREALGDFNRTLQLCDEYKSDYYRLVALFFRADVLTRLGMLNEAEEDLHHIPDDYSIWTDDSSTKPIFSPKFVPAKKVESRN